MGLAGCTGEDREYVKWQTLSTRILLILTAVLRSEQDSITPGGKHQTQELVVVVVVVDDGE